MLTKEFTITPKPFQVKVEVSNVKSDHDGTPMSWREDVWVRDDHGSGWMKVFKSDDAISDYVDEINEEVMDLLQWPHSGNAEVVA